MDVNRKHLNVLIQLAEADKHFARVEREMILTIARSKGLSDNEVRNLIKFPEPIELESVSADEKLEYLISSIKLVIADRHIFDVEILFCKKIAAKLGFKPEVIDFLLESVNSENSESLKQNVMNEFLLEVPE